MKYRDIENKSLQELKSMVESLRTELGKLNFDLASNTLKDTSKVKDVRRDVARVLTAFNKKLKDQNNK